MDQTASRAKRLRAALVFTSQAGVQQEQVKAEKAVQDAQQAEPGRSAKSPRSAV